MTTRSEVVAGMGSLLASLLVLTSCFQRPYLLRYISFEKVEGIAVESRAEPELDDLMFAAEIPVEYSLQRPGYRLSIQIERDSFRPRAIITLHGENTLGLVPRPRFAMRPGRAAPCGGYDEVEAGRELLFSWSICGDDASPFEFMVAFDIVDATGAVVRAERLPFELKRAGIHWADDSL